MAERTSYTNRKEQSQSEISFYWQYYGLSRDPFSAVRDDSMYFSLQSWEYHLDLLQHLIKSENVLLAVIGAEGVGKSTLAHQFMHQIGDAMQIHQFEADSLFSTRKLVRELEQGFHLKAPINESPEEQLDAQIAEVQYSDKTCLLIIDDAHFLPLETLNSLLFLLKQQSKNQMRLHILLFGDKNLQTKLANLAKHEVTGGLIHTVELHPLTVDETKQYIMHRLQKAGLTGQIPFSQMDLEKIYSTSNGSPDRINRMAQQILLDELAKQKSYSNPSLLKKYQSKAIGGLLVVGVLVGAAYLLNNRESGQHVAAVSAPAPVAKQPVIEFADHSQSETLPPPAQPQVAPQQQQTMTVATTTMPATDIIPAVLVPHRVVTQQPTNAFNSAVPRAAVAAKALDQIKQAQLNQQAKKSARLAQLEQDKLSPRSSRHHKDLLAHQAEKKTHKHAAIKEKLATTTTPHVKLAATSAKVTAKSTLQKSVSANTNTQVAVKPTTVKNSAEAYTLQLAGLSHESSLKDFLAKHPNASYVKSMRNGKPWYVITYGKYASYKAAENAIKQMPQELQQLKPWPRTYASVSSAKTVG